jgi:hypothetical protein
MTQALYVHMNNKTIKKKRTKKEKSFNKRKKILKKVQLAIFVIKTGTQVKKQ